MKLVFIVNGLDVGGAETNVVNLTHEMQKRGHALTVISSGGSLEAELAHRGIRHIDLPISVGRPALLVRTALRVARLIDAERPHIVHSMAAAANLTTQLARRGGGTWFLSSPMGLQQSDREPAFVTDLRNRLIVWRADVVLLISEEIAAAVKRTGIEERRLVKGNLVGVDFMHYRPAPHMASAVRTQLQIPGDAPVVTTIGALHPRKRHDLFIDAAARLMPQFPRARFIIVGEGPERRKLETQVRRLGLQERVILTGQRRDIADVLAATDIYVKPGIVEGFIGITVLEAMGCGRPVIAFRTQDVRAAIVDRETGLLVPNADTRELASGIALLLTDVRLATALAEKGRNHVVTHFSLQTVASELEDFYARVAL